FAALVRVIRFDDFLADVAPAGHVREALAPVRFSDQPPYGVLDVIFAPFQVVDPVLLDVAHGNDLHVGARENSADLADRLSAEADTGQGYLLAGCNEPRPPDRVSPHDGKRCRGPPAGHHQLAPRQGSLRTPTARLTSVPGR